MSRITRISVYSHCNNLGGKLWNPAICWTKKFAIFVELEDDEGRVGLGECWCFDAAPDALTAFLRTEVAHHYLGQNLDDAKDIAAGIQKFATLSARHGILASALSGFDIAIWDLRAQIQAVPLWKMLNPAGSGQAALYASGGLYGADKSELDLATEMVQFAQEGFRLSKMKVGALDPATDLARIYAVLAALPNDARLIVDCVYSYDYDTAARLFDQLPSERIEAMQSPLAADDIGGMARLVAAGVPVMATESEYRSELHRELIDRRAVRFLQTAPIACGGISRVRALSKMTRNTSVELSLEVSSTAVALTAAAHLAAADIQITHVEYHAVHQVFFDDLPLVQPKNIGDRFALPTTTGLGISLPRDALNEEFNLNEQHRDSAKSDSKSI